MMMYRILLFVCLFWVMSIFSVMYAGSNTEKDNAYFENPLMEKGADPWSTFYEGTYYYMHTVGNCLDLWKTEDLTAVRNAENRTIWTPPANMHSIWAPEIHRINGKWYVYFSAIDEKEFGYHQMYVLENENEDPFTGDFVFKGRLATDPDNNWAIDGSVFEHHDEWFVVWSGWPQVYPDKQVQCIYIAKLTNPWTIGTQRVLLSQPEYDWEKNYKDIDGENPFEKIIYVNEGPQPLFDPDSTYVHIVYSASGVWTPFYQLGLLTADFNSDLLDPNSWKKSEQPIFSQSERNSVFAPGHNSFFKSPDGTEDYILYHARNVRYDSQVQGEGRSPRAQKFIWKKGFPIFGEPVRLGVKLHKPSR